MKDIFDHNLNIYISHATEPSDRCSKILIGSYVTKDKKFTNISKPIKFTEILMLDIINLKSQDLENLFPNNNYAADGRCVYISEEEQDYDDNERDDYRSSYEKYGGYNGYSDDIIDDVFDGNPDATWNVD